jgi:hypothetical protein
VTNVAFGPNFTPQYQATGTMDLASGQQFAFNYDLGVSCGTLSFSGSFAQLSSPAALSAVRDAMRQ